jgi:hypothetical protein
MIILSIWFQELRYQIGAFQGMTKWSWPTVKIIFTTGVYLTCGPSGPDPRLSGSRGRPARVWGSSAGALVATRLHKEEKAKLVEKVSGGWSTRPAIHVAWMPALHLAPNRPLQASEGPIHPYKLPPHGESHFVVLHMQRLWFSSSSAGEALSGVESRVESLLELQK